MPDTQLCQCAAGDFGIITRVDGDSHITARLQEMGVLPGQWVRMIKPGNPVIFQIGDSRLCVRASQLDGVRINTFHPASQGQAPKLDLALLPDQLAQVHVDRSN